MAKYWVAFLVLCSGVALAASLATAPWYLEIESGGGGHGRGEGTYLVTSDSEFAYIPMTGEQHLPCRARLNDSERVQLDHLILSSDPESWGFPNPSSSICSDTMGYQLFFMWSDGGQRDSVTYDWGNCFGPENPDALVLDLLKLLRSFKNRIYPACSSSPFSNKQPQDGT